MSFSFAIPPGNVARARRAVRSALVGLPTECVETVELLTSEVMTNALIHASDAATLELHIDEHRVRIEVTDLGQAVTLAPLQMDVRSEHGRGLAIVDALASSWGVEPRSNGKAVWFEVRLE